MHIPQNFLPRSRQKLLRSAPGQSFPAVAVMPLAAKVLKKVMVNTGGNKRQVPAKRQNRGSRNSSYRVLSRKNRLNSVVQPLSTASRLVSTKFPILRGYANGVKRAYLYYIIAESLYGFAEQGVTGEYSLSTG